MPIAIAESGADHAIGPSLDPIDHLPLVYDLARRHVPPGQSIPESDAFGDGSLALVMALGRVDPSRTREISTFLAKSIRGGILKGFRTSRSRWAGDRGPVPFSDVEDDGLGGSYADRIEDHRGCPRCEDRDLVDWLLGWLMPRERRLVERVIMHGWLMVEAGAIEEPAITPQWVSVILMDAIRKMKLAAQGADWRCIGGNPE